METKAISEVAPIVVWQSIVNQLCYETEGFSLPLDTLTDDELTALKPIPAAVIEYAADVFRAISPRHHAELRRTVAYLNHLNALQAGAWERINAKYAAQQDKVTAYINRHGRK